MSEKTKSALEVSEDQAAAVQAEKAPGTERVTLSELLEKIDNVTYLNPETDPTLTIAVIRMKNGFSVVGKSACADPALYNAALGQSLAKDDALRQVWAHEGYLLCERLALAGRGDEDE
jgi:hypothetical protein